MKINRTKNNKKGIRGRNVILHLKHSDKISSRYLEHVEKIKPLEYAQLLDTIVRYTP